MDKNMEFINEQRIARTIQALKRNNMDSHYIQNEEELHRWLKKNISERSVVSFGGSMTLFETKTISLLREMDIELLDRYKEGLSREDIKDIYYKAFGSDFYLTSSNAITENGYLFNVDGRGNRVAAITYGPKKVVIIAGVNKIVKDEQEAIRRNHEIAAPINAKRLNRKTPCAIDGVCRECSSEDRICCSYVFTKRQIDKGRITVLLLKDSYGY